MEQIEIIDVLDINEEFEKITNRQKLLSDRFLAIAMDYKYYLDRSFTDNKIYELRDSIQYRLFSARLHVELLLRQHLIIQQKLEEDMRNKPERVTGSYFPSNPFFDIYQKEISSIFDSFIYHAVSVFDYLSSLTNYISGVNKQDTLMWTQLIKPVRDDKNDFSKKSFSKSIINIDRDFVNKLYDHRAMIIHRKADLGGYDVRLYLGEKGRIEAKFLTGKNFVKSFKELKELSQSKYPTIQYSAFWLLNKTFDKVTAILFALKEEMKVSAVIQKPIMFYLDPNTNKAMPVSVGYWHEDQYLKSKE